MITEQPGGFSSSRAWSASGFSRAPSKSTRPSGWTFRSITDGFPAGAAVGRVTGWARSGTESEAAGTGAAAGSAGSGAGTAAGAGGSGLVSARPEGAAAADGAGASVVSGTSGLVSTEREEEPAGRAARPG